MRILLIHQAFVSPNEAGGTRHFELASHCLDNGIDFSIVASDLSYLTGKKTVEGGRVVSKQRIGNILVYRAYTYPSLHKSFVWRVASFLSFMTTSIIAALRAGQVDVVMGTSPPIFQAVSAWVSARIKRTPFLLEIRDLWPEFAIDMGILKNPVLIGLSKRLESFLYAEADHIVVNSPAYRDYLIGRGMAINKISLIPNGVEPGMFETDSQGERIREEFGLGEKFVVTYAGALGAANDLSTLIAAAEKLKHHERIHVLIVGDGKERKNLIVLTELLELSNITFTGARAKSEMPEFLAASDACVAILQNIPMFKTTYPNKVFDYMAAGKPTILAIDGVIRQVVEAAEGGVFVPPGDADALADSILKLANAPDNARRMGESARDYVIEHFDRKKQAGMFVQLLRQVQSVGVGKTWNR